MFVFCVSTCLCVRKCDWSNRSIYDAYLSDTLGQRALVDAEQIAGELVHTNRVGQRVAQKLNVVRHPVHQLVQDRLQADGLFEFAPRKRCRRQDKRGELFLEYFDCKLSLSRYICKHTYATLTCMMFGLKLFLERMPAPCMRAQSLALATTSSSCSSAIGNGIQLGSCGTDVPDMLIAMKKRVGAADNTLIAVCRTD